jgi:hypothetical protein
LAIARGYLQRVYDLTGDPSALIARALSLPIIMGSLEEVREDRARVEAGLDALLATDTR